MVHNNLDTLYLYPGWPWPALAYFGCPGPGLYPGQPWFTLAAGGQSNQIQGIRGVIYLTRADPGQPWPTLVTLEEQSSGCTPALWYSALVLRQTVHLYCDILYSISHKHWPALDDFSYPGAEFRLYICTVITVHLYWDRLFTYTVINVHLYGDRLFTPNSLDLVTLDQGSAMVGLGLSRVQTVHLYCDYCTLVQRHKCLWLEMSL